MNKPARSISLSIYIVFVLLLALVALGMSFISDGSMPVYVHVVTPLIVGIIFIAPVVIWRKSKTSTIPSPLPVSLRKHQDKIIVVFLTLWVVGAAISYFVTRGN